MERCRNLGFALFQGRYFAQAEIVSGRRLSASQAALIRLINLVGRDVDVALIEDAFKHEPALTLNLLRVVNSVGHRGNRLAQPVTSLRHAINLFGRRHLQRWLSLLLLAPGSDSSDPAPLAAAAGGRAARTHDGAADRRRPVRENSASWPTWRSSPASCR
jgi:c-di-GMP-related signal transduction protein